MKKFPKEIIEVAAAIVAHNHGPRALRKFKIGQRMTPQQRRGTKSGPHFLYDQWSAATCYDDDCKTGLRELKFLDKLGYKIVKKGSRR